MKISAREILERAQKEGWALGAFNAANIETLKAIVAAANKLRAPVIVESSVGETDFFGPKNLVDVVKNFREEFNLPIFINLDHSTSEAKVLLGIEAGYEMLHFDGGYLPYMENLEITKRIVREAHKKGLLVEAEIDRIGGSSRLHDEDVKEAQKEGMYTDPDRAAEFVKETKVDTFAAFFGNVHGVYKDEKKLDFDLLRKLRRAVPCFLSMHGGSGITDEAVKKAIKIGIVKVNINTELRVAFRDALEKMIADSQEVAVYKMMPPVIQAVQDIVETKIKIFGSAGKYA
ncbi:MAG: class II fructose-bisphosphate aldolase [bacterium]|nr:class II fructose-bisphosphate aldolase [bacterium]